MGRYISLSYRIIFYYFAGASNCNCLGLLSRLLHLTKTEEKVIPLIVLVALFATTLPYLCQIIRNCWAAKSRNAANIQIARARFVLPFFLCGFLASSRIGAETLKIRGEYHFADYNPRDGTPYTDQQGTFHFTAILQGMTWEISVTNVDDPSFWSKILYDGTNTFTFVPYTTPFFTPAKVKPGETFVTITRSPYFLSAVSDWPRIYIPWIVYGLNPELVIKNADGSVEIPLPWETSRIKESAYGYDWKITPSQDGRFVARCEIIRDRKLDLSTPGRELLRLQLDYPDSVDDKDYRLKTLEYRDSPPSGFTNTTYECSSWWITNGWVIPIKAKLIQFDHAYKFAWSTQSLVVDSVQIQNNDSPLLGPPAGTTVVHDYRYKKSNDSRIFKYADYTLTTGENWKGPNEPTLLEKANDWLKHGRRYDWYEYSPQHILAWIIAVLFLLLPAVFVLIKKTQQNRKNNYE